MSLLSTFLQPNIVKVAPNIVNILYNVAIRLKKSHKCTLTEFSAAKPGYVKTYGQKQVNTSVVFQHIRSKREQKGRKNKKNLSFYQLCFNLF